MEGEPRWGTGWASLGIWLGIELLVFGGILAAAVLLPVAGAMAGGDWVTSRHFEGVLSDGTVVRAESREEFDAKVEESGLKLRSVRFETAPDRTRFLREFGPSPKAIWVLLAPHVLGLFWLLGTERGTLLRRLAPSGRGLAWGIAGGLGMLGFGIAWSALLQALGAEPPDVASYLRTIVPSRIVLCLWGALLVPIVEEGWFRGRFLDAVRSRVGVGWAFVLTSLGFAAIHGLPIFVPAYLVFAAVLFALRERTGSLFAPIVAHALNNLIGILIPGI